MCIFLCPIIIASNSCWYEAVLCIKRMCDTFNFCFSDMTTSLISGFQLLVWNFITFFGSWYEKYGQAWSLLQVHLGCSLFQERTKLTGSFASPHMRNFVINCVQIGTERNWKNFWNISFLLPTNLKPFNPLDKKCDNCDL
jgi:hypothetical protein